MEWDFLIIGSGFGGSVSALRLVEKGYRVLMLEKGRRFQKDDLPTTNWDLRRWFWAPRLGGRGFFRMTFLRHMTVLSGVGVGGGSLCYAATLPVPKKGFFTAAGWSHLADWEAELAPHYVEAKRMLGATLNPQLDPADCVLREVAEDLGRAKDFHPTDVGIYFGEPGVEVLDPYLGGGGPTRTGCTRCGGCMVGCRFNAKNTLDFNYLWLAERQGLELLAETEVTWIRALDDGGYEVEARQGLPPLRRRKQTFRARRVILAGGVLGTVPLLLKLRASQDGLPGLSPRLGELVRTNSEALLGVVSTRRDLNLSEGVAIGSILETDEHSHLEPVRYPAGSGFFRLLGAPHVPGSNVLGRVARSLVMLVLHPRRTLRTYLVRDWARRTMILLFMRSHEGHLRLRRKRLSGRVTTELSAGPKPTPFMPEAAELAQRVAGKIGGFPQGLVSELLLGTPTTAHVLGGCVMGDSAEEGVIDACHRVFGYEGVYVIDGSAISANPGVNPSLTIAALAERAMSLIPPAERGGRRPARSDAA